MMMTVSGNGVRIYQQNDDVRQNNQSVYYFLKSDALAKLTLSDKVFAGIITHEELSDQLLTQEIFNNLRKIAKFYEEKAEKAEKPEVKREYLLQAAMIYQTLKHDDGQRLKAEWVARSELEVLEEVFDKYQQSTNEQQSAKAQQLAKGWGIIPLVIFIGFLMLAISNQLKFFFQNRQYLRLVLYSIVIVVTLISLLVLRNLLLVSFMDIPGKYGESLLLFIYFPVAAWLYFFYVRQRFQNQAIRLLFRILILVTLFLPISLVVGNLEQLGILILILGIFYVRKRFIQSQGFRTLFIILLILPIIFYLVFNLDTLDSILLLVITMLLSLLFLVVWAIFLLPIPLTSYALLPSDKWWRWPLKGTSMLLAYAILFIIALFLIGKYDSALAFYNPIQWWFRGLLLIVAGAILEQTILAQFMAYQQQQKWLTIVGFAGVYSLILSAILYVSLTAFFDGGTLPIREGGACDFLL